MRIQQHSTKRRGAIIPLVAICLVVILGLVALAIDIGMVAVAKTQAQNAADAAALAGTRTFNQNTGYNLNNVPKQAVTTAVANKLFNAPFKGDPNNIVNPAADIYTSGDVKVEAGGYYYVYNDGNTSLEGFKMAFPPTAKPAAEPYTAVRVTITTTSPMFFGGVFGTSPFNVKATSVAAHRPRDVVIVMDLSGSMRFQSCPGAYFNGTNTYPHWGPRTRSFNPDPLFPKFGHYSAISTVAFQGSGTGTTGAEQIDQANISIDNNSGAAVLKDFMTTGSTLAFPYDSAKDTQNLTPGGDNFLQASSTYIKTVGDFVGATPTPAQVLDFERGVTGYTGTWNGYSEGPGYWGKTFFIWPPNPGGSDLDASVAANHADNGAKDWRQRFFFKKRTSDGALFWLDNNNLLFNTAAATGTATSDGSGVTPIMRQPNQTRTITENGVGVSYRVCINYAAIFKWLKTTPTHFPNAMTTGRIKFWTAIPDPTGDSGFNNRFWTQYPMTDLNERFWKDYVDFMLGYVENGVNTYDNSDGTNPFTSYLGNGDMWAWGTPLNTTKQDSNYVATVSNSGGYATGHTGSLAFANVKDLAGATVDLAGPQPITNASFVALQPVVITSNGHGLVNGNIVTIFGVGGVILGNVNKTWTVTVVDANRFSLNGSTGTTGVYVANTGSWIPAITGASTASPIVITTGAPHKMPLGVTGTVNITGISGNPNALGKHHITVINATQFSLTGTTGASGFTMNDTSWWEPVYYIRFGMQSTAYELNPALTTIGTLTATPDIALKAAAADASAVKIYTTVPRYMSYTDNPFRPRHHFWFGPQTWVDWLGNYSVGTHNGKNYLRWPGNVHEAQAWSCKVGISAAIDDIRNNHPNDFVGMTFFSAPSYSTGGGGNHNVAVVPLGREYQKLKDSLWFPPSTVAGIVSTITPFDPDFQNVPRARGGTCPGMGMMLTYNLLGSSLTNLRNYPTNVAYRGYVGGLGRKGSNRLVIFETDGAPNTRAVRTITSAGANSYYPVRLKDPGDITNSSNEFPTGGSYAEDEVFAMVTQICAQTTATPPGYSTARKPAQVFALGYGTLFDPGISSPAQAPALDFLQGVQYRGNVSTTSGGATFPNWQRIYGTSAQKEQRIRDAFTAIMQAGVQVSLLE